MICSRSRARWQSVVGPVTGLAALLVVVAVTAEVAAADEKVVLLTPKPAPAPQINGPAVYGCRPGRPLIYRIPTTGTRPIACRAEGLPASLRLDPAIGIITGTAPARGTYSVSLHASNSAGRASRSLKIIAGDTLALTPPMGWNHWYAHYARITDQRDDLFVGVVMLGAECHPQCRRDRCAGVANAEYIAAVFSRAGKAAESVLLPQTGKVLPSAG